MFRKYYGQPVGNDGKMTSYSPVKGRCPVSTLTFELWVYHSIFWRFFLKCVQSSENIPPRMSQIQVGGRGFHDEVFVPILDIPNRFRLRIQQSFGKMSWLNSHHLVQEVIICSKFIGYWRSLCEPRLRKRLILKFSRGNPWASLNDLSSIVRDVLWSQAWLYFPT